MKKYTNIPVVSHKHNKPIVTDVFYSENQTQKPLVVFCHGYKGFKDWGAWNLMAEEFVNAGYFFSKFNFSHNGGTLENPIDFPDLEAFGQNNFSLELDDLEVVLDWVLEHSEYSKEIDKDNITLIGHSRGGGIATLKTRENNKIKRVISWAGVSDFGRRFPSGLKLWYWQLVGKSYILNTRTNQKMPHYAQIYRDFKQHEDRLTISKAAKEMKIPHLLIHGGQDDIVPLSEAQEVHAWNPKSELIVFPEMDHALGCAEPYLKAEMPKFLSDVVGNTIEFIKRT